MGSKYEMNDQKARLKAVFFRKNDGGQLGFSDGFAHLESGWVPLPNFGQLARLNYLTAYQKNLYAATSNSNEGAEIWRMRSLP
jgi:hypothetical protein